LSLRNRFKSRKFPEFWQFGKVGERAIPQRYSGLKNPSSDQLALLPDTPERQRQELEFLSALGAVLISVKGQAAPEAGVPAHENCGSSWVLLQSSFRSPIASRFIR
jgi:hypothetical protein